MEAINQEASTIGNTGFLEKELPVNVWQLVSICLLGGTALAVAIHSITYSTFNWIHAVLAFFLVLNILNCFWEISLFLRINYINKKHNENLEIYRGNEGALVSGFLTQPVRRKDLLSFTFWADIWSVYAIFDDSYADKRSFGYFVDSGNGFTTLISTIIVLIGMTCHFLSPVVFGIIALILFHQMIYGTAVYWLSFIVNKRYKIISWQHLLIYIVGSNGVWFVCSIVGAYATVQVLLSNSYAVFL